MITLSVSWRSHWPLVLAGCVLAGAAAVPARAADGGEDMKSLPLKGVGGWALLPDGVTLVVGRPDGKLDYIDTVAVKELKQVDAPVRPDLLAGQGQRLFVGSKGGNVVHVLDRDSGEDKKEIKLPDGGLVDLVCNTDKGAAYAALARDNRIAAIDPAAAAAALLQPRGKNPLLALNHDGTPEYPPYPLSGALTCLAMDPNHADTLYATYLLEGRRTSGMAVLAKFTVKGKALEGIGVNQNAALGDSGHDDSPVVRVSGDGKKVGVADGYGYRAQVGAPSPDRRMGVFTADNVSTLDGLVTCGIMGFQGWGKGRDMAFHPVLDLGVVEEANATTVTPPGGNGQWLTRLHLFHSKSLAEITTFELLYNLEGKPGGPLLTFGGRGTKLIYYDGSQGQLRFIPLTLSDKDKETLAKAYPAR
jgi:hypothetical protein